MTSISFTRAIEVYDGSARPAWRNTLARWQWYEIPGTINFSGVLPTTIPGGSDAGRLNAWNGFAASGSAVYTAGMGGHTDYAGNEAYKIDLNSSSPTWTILRQPTPAAYLIQGTIGNSQPLYALEPDGKRRPSSGHLYYSLHVVGDEIIRTDNGSQWGDGNANDDKCFAFDLTTNDWRPDGTYPNSPSGAYSTARCKDPRDGTIYYAGSSGLYKRNPSTGVYTLIGPWAENETSVYYRASAVDTLRNRVVFFGDAYRPSNGGIMFDLTSNARTAITFSGTGVSSVVAQSGHSAWYDTGLDRFLVKTDTGSTIYSVNPTTFEVSLLSTTGGSSILNAVNGVFNKFVYVPDLRGYFYQPQHTSTGVAGSNAWFLASE